MTNSRSDQRLKERLATIQDWAEANPYTGVHDAPPEVKKALGYKGTGAKLLADRLQRRNR